MVIEDIASLKLKVFIEADIPLENIDSLKHFLEKILGFKNIDK
ncbi:10824_t:CDS:2 [Entrophospora sp. SA101]|nr:10824_t:CDS:2 [Entrophospora sp. SA101]